MISFEEFKPYVQEYAKYLSDHIKNVQKGYAYFKENLPEYIDQLEIPIEEMDEQIQKHDASKYSDEEFLPYANHYYGKFKNIPAVDTDYQQALIHHYQSNPHHPEYWNTASDMPLSCIIEMICDWWSFSWKNDDLYEIVEWYRENRAEKASLMSENTILKVDEIIEALTNTFQKYSAIIDNTLVEQLISPRLSLQEAVVVASSVVDMKTLKQIDSAIRNADKIVVARHISPDADAIFSAKAMYTSIKMKYPKKEVILANDMTKEWMTPKDLLIILDLGVQSRISGEIIGKPKTIRIDHHPDMMPADILLQQDTSGSTCELVTIFLSEMKYPITKEIAEGLFKGIISDTGRMQYSLSQTTLAALSILNEYDVDYKKIYNRMYVKEESSTRAKAYILSNYKKTPSGVVYLFLNKARCLAAGIDLQKTSEMVYELAEIKDYPIWVILKETGSGDINMSIRSRTIPINQIAKLFGGGGHENAAGIKVHSRDDAKKVLMKLDEYVKNMKLKNPALI